MALYLIVSLVPLLFAGLYPKSNADSRKAKWYYLAVGIVLILFMGLRSRFIGSTDTCNYYNMFQRAINAGEWSSYYNPDGVESGFQLFLWLLSRVFHNPQWIIVASSVIYVVSIFVFCERNSRNVPMSLVMYISLGLMQFEMQGMRQSIAMSICLFAYAFAKKKKIIPFALLVFLAMQFHQTAIVFALIYFLRKLKIKALYMLIFLVVASGALFGIERIIDVANELFERNYTGTVDSGGYVAVAIYVLIIIFTFVVSKRPYNKHINSLALYMLFLGFICFIVRYIGALAAERVSFYFMFSQTIILPNTIVDGRLESEDARVVNFIVYGLCISLFAYRLFGSDFLPYHFFWEGLY